MGDIETKSLHQQQSFATIAQCANVDRVETIPVKSFPLILSRNVKRIGFNPYLTSHPAREFTLITVFDGIVENFPQHQV